LLLESGIAALACCQGKVCAMYVLAEIQRFIAIGVVHACAVHCSAAVR
jgi:hypothetical protein